MTLPSWPWHAAAALVTDGPEGARPQTCTRPGTQPGSTTTTTTEAHQAWPVKGSICLNSQAMVMLVISILATTIVGADTGLFNGNAGLSLIPNPLASVDPARRGWYYVAVVAVICTAGYLVLRRFTTGPLGRALRAVR